MASCCMLSAALLSAHAAPWAAPPAAPAAACAAAGVLAGAASPSSAMQHQRQHQPLFQSGAPMVCLPGGAFMYGNAFPGEGYAADGEAAQVRAHVGAFAIDATEVTNAQFSAFVNATGHVTDAERFGDSFVYVAQLTAAGRAATAGALRGAPWWVSVRGASWRAPHGGGAAPPPAEHPVAHVSHGDAAAFCAAAGKRLPSEREWEYAARGGLDSRRFPWGDDDDDETLAQQANTFAGDFPWQPTRVGAAPVGSYAPNAFGLFDMAGNVWEWTADELSESRRPQRGGSFMCHRRGCHRYRVSARLAQTPESTASHVGFRCVADAGSAAFAACATRV